MLEDDAENFRLHFRPVGFRALAQEHDFGAGQLQPRGLREQAAIEIRHAFEASAGGDAGRVHLGEEIADEIVGAGCVAFVEQTGDEVFVEQVDVFREKRDEHLEREALGQRAPDATLDEFVEALGKAGGGFARDGDVIVVEDGLWLAGEEKGERAEMLREINEGDAPDGRIHLRLEIIDVELVEVAQHDVARAAWHGARPIIERLAIVFRQVHAALFHLDEDDRLPNVVGEAGAAAVLAGFANAELRLAADIQRTAVAESLHQTVEKDLRLAFLVPRDVGLCPSDEGRKFLRAWIAHAQLGFVPDEGIAEMFMRAPGKRQSTHLAAQAGTTAVLGAVEKGAETSVLVTVPAQPFTHRKWLPY